MSKAWSLVAFGVGAFAIFLITTLPPGVLLDRFERYGVRATGVSGSVWQGAAAMLEVRNVAVGQIAWDIHPLSLLGGRLQADVKLTRPDGFAHSTLTASFSGRLR